MWPSTNQNAGLICWVIRAGHLVVAVLNLRFSFVCVRWIWQLYVLVVLLMKKKVTWDCKLLHRAPSLLPIGEFWYGRNGWPLAVWRKPKAIESGPVGPVWAGPTFGTWWVWQYAIAILVDVVIWYRPAPCAHQYSVRIRSSCRTSNSCNNQVSGTSNARMNPRLEGKQRSINHHHHNGYKYWYCRFYKPNQPLAGFWFRKRSFGKTKMLNRSCQYSWFSRWPFLHYDEGKDTLSCHTCLLGFRTCVYLIIATPTSGPD